MDLIAHRCKFLLGEVTVRLAVQFFDLSVLVQLEEQQHGAVLADRTIDASLRAVRLDQHEDADAQALADVTVLDAQIHEASGRFA